MSYAQEMGRYAIDIIARQAYDGCSRAAASNSKHQTQLEKRGDRADKPQIVTLTVPTAPNTLNKVLKNINNKGKKMQNFQWYGLGFATGFLLACLIASKILS